MRSVAAVLAVLALLFAAGCGDDDESTTTTTTSGATGASGASGESGAVGETVEIGDVESCLADSGFEAAPSENELIGVESANERLDVAFEDLDQAAAIVVFESAEDAEAEAEAADVAMGVGDTRVAGNAIWGVDSSVDEAEELEAGVEGCLPR